MVSRRLGKRLGPSAGRRLWLLTTLAVWAAAVTFYAISPALFSGLARVMPAAWEAYLGDISYASFMRSGMVAGVNEEASADPELRWLHG